MRADDTLPLGSNEVLLSISGWAEARVRDGRASFEIKPTPKKKLEPITTRIRKTIPLGRNKYFIGLAFEDNGKNLIGSTDQGCAVMDLEHSRIDLRFPWAPDPTVTVTMLSADKQTLFVGRAGMRAEQVVNGGKTTSIYHQTGRLDAFSVSTCKKLSVFEGRESSSIFGAAVSPDGRWLAFNERTKFTDVTAISFSIVLWDLKSNTSIQLGRYSSLGSMSFSPDSKRLIATIFGVKGAKSQLLSWDVPNPTPTVLAADAETLDWGPSLSSDGKWMLLRRYLKDPKLPIELELRRRSDNQSVWKKKQSPDGVSSFSIIDPENRVLAFGETGKDCRLLDLETLNETKAFEFAPKAALWTPQFSPDGTKLAINSQDISSSNPRSTDPDSFEQPLLWLLDLSRPTMPERVVLPSNRSWRFRWTPDGKSIVVEGLERHLVLDATNISPSTR